MTSTAVTHHPAAEKGKAQAMESESKKTKAAYATREYTAVLNTWTNAIKKPNNVHVLLKTYQWCVVGLLWGRGASARLDKSEKVSRVFTFNCSVLCRAVRVKVRLWLREFLMLLLQLWHRINPHELESFLRSSSVSFATAEVSNRNTRNGKEWSACNASISV